MQTTRAELGRRIRELRKARSLSQEKLGELADLHATYVGGIERGERNVSFENLARLASAFGLTLSQLFDFQKAGKSRRETLRATLFAALQKRNELELRCVQKIVAAIDDLKGDSRE